MNAVIFRLVSPLNPLSDNLLLDTYANAFVSLYLVFMNVSYTH